MSVLSRPWFHDEAAAYAHLEGVLWPDGPVCPHCRSTERVRKLEGAATRPGVHKCYACRKQMTVKVGTVFESSHVPLHKWLQAVYLLCSSKKGISSHQLARILEVTYKTAWFMAHRVREAMRDGSLAPLGGEGKAVEADETYFGPKDGQAERARHAHGPRGKRAVVALVERGGAARSFHVERADKATVGRIVRENVARESALMTDESRLYGEAGAALARHGKVTHSAGEYVRDGAHTNTIEGVFSIFKRGMRGVYQHCGEKHLHRYLAEFDFRYNNRAALGVDDAERAEHALSGAKGRRLTYRSAD